MTRNGELRDASDRITRIEFESQKLLDAASVVLQSEDFLTAARGVFDIAKELTGASSGYVALLSEDGSENEVLFLDAGGLPCTVDESLPMPIRGLREVAYRENRAAYDNNFMNSEWVKFMPDGHVKMDNVIFGPLIISGKAEGLIGLANKPSDFTDDDARIVMALANLVAIGLRKAKVENELRASEKKLSDTINELQLYGSLLRHDLSNDLQLIIGEVELAKLNVNEDSRMSGYLESIDSASSRMLRLIQVFKDIDSVDEKNVRDLIQHLVEETRKSYPHVTISSHIKPTEESVVIKGKSLIPFVFDNLIRNAVQHVGPNVEVNIYMAAKDENVVIDFVDNGPGIDKELSKTLFQKGESKTRGGFGLYLCKKIIEIYSGSISLLPTDVYNKGTAFRVELPRIKEDTLPKAHSGY